MGTDPTPRVLFLHGGPGMTVEMERGRYGTTLPVHWWNQPRVASDTPDPYQALIEAAVEEVARLAQGGLGRVDLLACAFGAYLARALVHRVPALIGAVTILSGVWDLSAAVLRLGWHFAHLRRDADLWAVCHRAAEADTPQSYFTLFARVSAIPGFLDACWSPGAQEPREAMRALAAEGRLIDWPTCQAVMTAALAVTQTALPAPHPGRVRIVSGRFDPCFDAADLMVWRAMWPGASVQVVDAAQFPHLELPSSAWMRGPLLLKAAGVAGGGRPDQATRPPVCALETDRLPDKSRTRSLWCFVWVFA